MSEVAAQNQWSLSRELRDPALEYDRFREICAFLGTLDQELKFAIGDAVNLGPEIFGDPAYQALELLNISEEAKREYGRVAARVPISRRKKGISWSHHRAVAALDPPAQAEWLARVRDEGLSHHALRDALRNGDEPRAASTCRCCGRELE